MGLYVYNTKTHTVARVDISTVGLLLPNNSIFMITNTQLGASGGYATFASYATERQLQP